MDYPKCLLQPSWVLDSASADQGNALTMEKTPSASALLSWTLIQPGWLAWHQEDHATAKALWSEALQTAPDDLLLHRVINDHAPELLHQPIPDLLQPDASTKIALVLPGELRCLRHSQQWLQALTRRADLFVCTSAAYADAAQQLDAEALIVDPEPTLPVGTMHQWQKLALALQRVRARELSTGIRYTHILKLRSDFYHLQPSALLPQLVAADGLLCASDKVFGGQRDVMMLFEGFFSAVMGHFDGQELAYWPINSAQILCSDDSFKWYGMLFPQELIGQPNTAAAFRENLHRGGDDLHRALLAWRPPADGDPQQLYWRLFKGHPRFASEICFARFLNFNGIPVHGGSGLLGFLRSDRLRESGSPMGR